MAAYTYRAVGSATSGTTAPGMPAGWQVGDLLLLATCARLATETLVDPAGWTRLADTTGTDNDSLILYGRIAESGDTGPSIDWSGTSASRHQIAAFYGDVETTLANIVVHVAAAGATSNTANIPNPALTITTADCLVIGIGKKQKTLTTNSATMTSPSGLSNRISLSWPDGSNVGMVWDYTQQTTATNISSSVWTQSIAESLEYASLVVALKTLTTRTLKILAHSSAASAASVEVVVFSAPSGSDYLTGTTRYGSTNGQTFEAALEADEAVLLVPAADVGCSALPAGTVVAACARNATYTTGIIPATIVEA